MQLGEGVNQVIHSAVHFGSFDACESTVCVSYGSTGDQVLTVGIPLCEFSMSTFTFGMFDLLSHKTRYLFLYYLIFGFQA